VAINRGDVGGDDGFVVMQGNGVAKVKERSRIARGKFLYLAPGAAEIAKDVGGACARVTIDGRPEGTDEGDPQPDERHAGPSNSNAGGSGSCFDGCRQGFTFAKD
jgi:hypothetical protein